MNNQRYSRQLILPEIGRGGQQKLFASHVTIIGAGGLGSPASLYLAAAGVGHLRIIDGDKVRLTNLNRQVLYSKRDLMKPKADKARSRLLRFNSDIFVEGINHALSMKNARSLLEKSDIILDCVDNFETRFILNDIAKELRLPFIHGACSGFEGRLFFVTPDSVCLRCIYPPKPTYLSKGILGATAGVIGALQAIETIKWLLDQPTMLTRHMLAIDLLRSSFDYILLERSPKCPMCSGITK